MTYRQEVLRTFKQRGHQGDLANAAMGLAGEAGEVCDLVKKIIFHGHELDRVKLVNELGDVRWYLEVLCMITGTSLKEVETLNVIKLRERYPNGFSTADSIKRRDTKASKAHKRT